MTGPVPGPPPSSEPDPEPHLPWDPTGRRRPTPPPRPQEGSGDPQPTRPWQPSTPPPWRPTVIPPRQFPNAADRDAAARSQLPQRPQWGQGDGGPPAQQYDQRQPPSAWRPVNAAPPADPDGARPQPLAPWRPLGPGRSMGQGPREEPPWRPLNAPPPFDRSEPPNLPERTDSWRPPGQQPAPPWELRPTAGLPVPASRAWQPVDHQTRPLAALPPGGPGAAQAPAPTPPDGSGDRRDELVRHRRRALVPILVGAGVVVIIALAATVVYLGGGDVPRGTTVLGIDIGGKSRAEAISALRAGLVDQRARTEAPILIRIEQAAREVSVVPNDIRLKVNPDATIDQAIAGSGNVFSAAWQSAAGGGREVDPVIELDEAMLDEKIRKPIQRSLIPITEPAVQFTGTTPHAVYPRAGLGLDPKISANAVRASWLRQDVISVPLVEQSPKMTRADVDKLVTELAEPAVAAPVTITTSRGELTLSPESIAKVLVLSGDGEGKITPVVDAKKLRAELESQLGKVEAKPRSATITTGGGEPVVVASSGGHKLDTGRLAQELLPVLAKPAPRSIEGGIISTKPDTSTEQIRKLGITERVSTFTTTFTGGLKEPRNKNIVQVAKKVDGVLLKPGETFSLNGYTGPRGYAEGYVDAPVILNGILVPGVGGGISQFTTTLFNAAYYAGLEDVHHKPHSYHYSRYPAVIESTIFYPDLDLKFRNDTPHGVLIDTAYTQDSVTVSMWSTKVYDSVTTEYSGKRDVVQPTTEYLTPGPKCIATEGIPGFTQDAYRVFTQNGKEVKREKFTWRYDAQPNYVCGKKPS